MADRGKKAILAGLMAFLLTGCFMQAPHEMYALPQPPEDYKNLNGKIEEVLRALGGESIAPQTGGNTQTVQLQDLDGDGVQESAVAFFRVIGAESPLKVYIFRQQADERYDIATVIEGEGTAIYSISYENLGGSNKKEAVVAWQMSSNVHRLGAYSLEGEVGINLLEVGNYNRFRVSDLDQDGEKEIITLTLGTGDERASRADYYDYDGAVMALKSTAPLSSDIHEIRTVRQGNLVDNIPALFVASSVGEGQLVDILACRDGSLTNITMDIDSGTSSGTVRYYTAVSGTDINSDGALEIPHPEVLPSYNKVAGADDFWMLHWRQFDVNGVVYPVFTTYHNITDGWYFIIPSAWTGKITIARKDSTTADERAVIFSRWQSDSIPPQPFMVLYKLTGTNQTARASVGGRKTLFTDSTATYAYEFTSGGWDTGLTHDNMLQAFSLIRNEWATEY